MDRLAAFAFGLLFLVPVVMAVPASPVSASEEVANTVHNLSTSGPGPFKSGTVNEVCVFCHTPHNSRPEAPLWNRQLSGQTYSEYTSSTLQSVPGQPTGSSLLCLACHDGTVALGALVNPPGPSNDLETTFLTGRANIGTDLTNDHPISFTYDDALAAADQELASPAGIDLPLEGGQVQCTTCHDPHKGDIPPFLRKTTLNGDLCTTCHVRSGLTWDWNNAAHAVSVATPSGADPWAERKPAWKGATVAENACFNCHTPHNAATPNRLQKNIEENTCFLCHDGSVAASDIESELLKFSRHPVETTPNPSHDATKVENPLTMPLHVECTDCHNPHAAESSPPMISFNPNNPFDPDHATAPAASGRIRGVTGIDIAGNEKAEVDYEYELCFKCHGLPAKSACDDGRCETATSFSMLRQDGVYNIRDKVSTSTPGLVSYHPIEINNPANDDEVPSLRNDIPLNRSTSLIYCSDCHNSDRSLAAGLSGPTGPHGSIYGAILTQEYSFDPVVPYSSQAYELCYKCHDESAILGDASGFPHRKHVQKEDLACINCHDPHGSLKFPHLLNFLVNVNFGGQTFQITGAGGFSEPTWIDEGKFKGRCYLSCHGETHNGWRYPRMGGN